MRVLVSCEWSTHSHTHTPCGNVKYRSNHFRNSWRLAAFVKLFSVRHVSYAMGHKAQGMRRKSKTGQEMSVNAATTSNIYTFGNVFEELSPSMHTCAKWKCSTYHFPLKQSLHVVYRHPTPIQRVVIWMKGEMTPCNYTWRMVVTQTNTSVLLLAVVHYCVCVWRLQNI